MGDQEFDPFKKGVVPIWFIVFVVIPLVAYLLLDILLPASGLSVLILCVSE